MVSLLIRRGIGLAGYEENTVCVICACTCSCVSTCVGTYVHRGHRSMWGVFSIYFLIFETKSFAAHGSYALARMAGQQASRILCLFPELQVHASTLAL